MGGGDTPTPSYPFAKAVQRATAAAAKTLAAAAAKNTAVDAKAAAAAAKAVAAVVAIKAATAATAGPLVASATVTNDTSNHLANSALDVMENAHDNSIDDHIQQSTHDTPAHCMLRRINLELSTWTHVEAVQPLDLSAIGPRMPDIVFVGRTAFKFTPTRLLTKVALAKGQNLHVAFNEHFAFLLLAH